ncbi:hypothetical protein [Dokdonella sp.]|uniref:hypothetical protein n=1 Tax=Dokdonella sp. TaxID=2291710 RepID=UPI003783881D
MKRFAWIVALGLAFGSLQAVAFTTIGGPATGLWAHAGDGGRGFNIDIQGSTMIVTTFIYTQNGAPIWYLSSGTYNHATGRFQSSYDSYSDGQCFGCPAYQPTAHSGAAGPMSIQFHTNQTATLTTPNGPLEISKFNYGFASPRDLLYGEWVFTINAGGLVTGDWIVFDHQYTGNDGTVYAAGHADGSSTHVALGSYSSSLGEYIITALQSGSYVHSYALGMDDHRGLGAGWVHLLSSNPTGNGSGATASRVLYEGELTSINANAPANPAAATTDQQALVASDKQALAPELASEVSRQQAALREFLESSQR